MADSIKLGNLDISAFKVGSYDCKIYLGTVKLYPQNNVKNYLRTVAKENGTISLTIGSAITTNELSYVAYSTDSGTTWTTVNNVNDSFVTASTNVSNGDVVYWKGEGTNITKTAPSQTNGRNSATTFSSTAAFDVEGNAMSMLYGDNFEGQEFANGSTYNLSGLFYSATTLVNASGMTLPATASTENCYNDLFAECDHLLTVPTLSATTTAPSCFKRMFRRCRVLPSVPSDYLTNISTLSNECYNSMFSGCWALTAAPNLPTTTLANRCYRSMFEYCSGLTVAPTLSATTLVDECYYYMFRDCTSLQYINCQATNIPFLNSTYYWVYGVPSGGTFVRNENAAFNSWSYGINGVPNGWTVTPPYYAWRKAPTTDYVCDLETHTKYYKEYYSETYDLGMTWEHVTPEQSRTSEDVIEYNSVDCGYVPPVNNYFKITSLAANNTITLSNNTTGTTVGTTSFAYSLDSGSTWTSFTLTTGSTKTIATLASGDTVMLKGSNASLAHSYNYGHYFRGSGDYEISGEIASLITNDATDTELSGASAFTFAQLFSGDTHLVSAENLIISSTELPQSCFNNTFRSCTNLVKAPELPSTILGKEAYSSMFEGCTALSQPPSQLYFTSVQSDSYNRMFCMSRTSKVTTPAMTYTPKMFGNWGSVAPSTSNMQMFCGNGNLTIIYCYWTNTSGSFGVIANWVNYTADSGVTFYKRSTQSFRSSASGIKSGWTIINDDTTQPT